MPHSTRAPHSASPETEYVIKCAIPGWDKLRSVTGLSSDAQLAEVLDVNPSTTYRTLTGQTLPSNKFIAQTLHAFGHVMPFHRLFTLAPKDAA